MTNGELTTAFLRALEIRDGSALDYYAPHVTQQEFPNRLVSAGMTRDLDGLRLAAERGKAAVSEERYGVTRLVERGPEVAVEAVWTAKLAVPFGTLAPGDTMRAHLAIFLTWEDGKIVSQRNYDCFDPF